MSWSGDWADVAVPHSIAFGNKNSYVDWHLVPDGRPVIAMPPVKKTVVDIPGGYGSVDLSEALTNYPVYENRTGTLEFHMLNDYAAGEDWVQRYEDISLYLHGQQMNMTLADDPNWYYTGRYSVAWTSNNDGTGSTVSIEYDLDPLKEYYTEEVLTFSSVGTTYYYLYPLDGLKSCPTSPILTITSYSAAAPTVEIGVVNPELEIDYEDNDMTVGAILNKDISLYSITLSNNDGRANSAFTNSDEQLAIRIKCSSGTINGNLRYRRAML